MACPSSRGTLGAAGVQEFRGRLGACRSWIASGLKALAMTVWIARSLQFKIRSKRRRKRLTSPDIFNRRHIRRNLERAAPAAQATDFLVRYAAEELAGWRG